MNYYEVRFSSKAKKMLKKIDKSQALLILGWIKKNLVESENPRQFGKALTGELSSYWRYRVGAYRIIAEIKDNELIINLINVGHRKDIYKKK
jgi:mRNA interferase RelE/StbE